MHLLYIAFSGADVLALVALIGMLACWRVVLPQEPLESLESLDTTMRRLLFATTLFLTISSGGILLARTMEMVQGRWTAVPSALPLVVRMTHYGHVWLFRIPALIALWVGQIPKAKHHRRWWQGWIMMIAAAGIAMTRSETGHPADHGDFTLAVWIDWAHLLAGSLWVGSLFGMSLGVFPSLLTRVSDPGPRTAEIFARLSRLAALALGVVLVSGAYTAWHELDSLSALWDFAYGRTLSVKLLAVAGMVGLGAWNRYVHLPRLEVLSGKAPRRWWAHLAAFGTDRSRLVRLSAGTVIRECSCTVSKEALLGVIVIAAASTLLHGMPPAEMIKTAAAAGMPGMVMAPAGSPVPALGPHHWVDWPTAQAYIRRSVHAGRADRAGRVHFRGQAVTIDLIAVQPHYPDMSFELANRVNPPIVVSAGVRVTLNLLNMDYGPGMDHGVVLIAARPPYPALGVERLKPRLAMLDPIPARSEASLADSRYAQASVRFTTPSVPGTYYYACQWPGHAEGYHMYGKFEVRKGK